ncbi:MAG: hypothetical protein ACJA0U_003026 [Salibacteraceae bacterium]|jgi:hypothetical protein
MLLLKGLRKCSLKWAAPLEHAFFAKALRGHLIDSTTSDCLSYYCNINHLFDEK